MQDIKDVLFAGAWNVIKTIEDYPAEYERVLVFFAGKIYVGWLSDSEWLLENGEGICTENIERIVHWMRLPEFPK